jgi:uncharacterized protein
MTSVTLDVNVLVSAAITPRGTPYEILQAWQTGRFEVVISQHILTELLLKLRSDRIGRRYGLTPARIRAFTAPLRNDSRLIVVPAHEVRPVTGDPEDDAVLATAKLGQADYLVTGDKGLLDLGTHEQTHIVSPREFLAALTQDDG